MESDSPRDIWQRIAMNAFPQQFVRPITQTGQLGARYRRIFQQILASGHRIRWNAWDNLWEPIGNHKRAKTSPGSTADIETALGWIAPGFNNDPETSRPNLNAEAQRARVKITGTKPGFEAVNIYRRIKDEAQWKLVAVRKRKFPYYDESPLAVPNTPKVREYMVIGVVNDDEIGQTSEIKEVVYAG